MSNDTKPCRLLHALVPALCIIAAVCPVRASHRGYSIRLEFFWTQMHKLFGGISWQNAEILFPLGAFVLFSIALYFIVVVCLAKRNLVPVHWVFLLIHVLFRGFVDFHLLTSYFPLPFREFASPVTAWRLLAFMGGIASAAAVVLEVMVLWGLRRKRTQVIGKVVNQRIQRTDR